MRRIPETVSATLSPWLDTSEQDYGRDGLRGRCLGPLVDFDLVGLPWDTAPDPPKSGNASGSATPVCVKRSRTRCVLALDVKDPIGRPVRVYAKRCRVRNGLRRLVSIGRAGKCRREWDLGWRLLERGIPTALPLLWAEKRAAGGMMTENYLVTLGLENALPFRALWNEVRGSDSERRFWIEQLGRFVRRTHDAGFAHDDLSTSHIFLGQEKREKDDPPRFCSIDLDGGRLGDKVGPFRRTHNFFQVFRSLPRRSVGPEERRVFFDAYSEGAWDERRVRAIERQIDRIRRWKRIAWVFKPRKWF
ncbi:hypothetical protein JW916_05890 [Candidatus Sumerlaeota bacterium]|nr:hypothetical protein [Candidatus Sumerlaeota bacterium]